MTHELSVPKIIWASGQAYTMMRGKQMRARMLGSGSGCLAKADRDGSVNEGIQNTFLSNPGSWNNKVGWVRKSGVQKACLRAIALSFLSRYSRLYVQAGSYFTKYKVHMFQKKKMFTMA